ncbi:hypothetical protein K8Z61_11770 [Nocardioides sp. TRM66260-LWL]|uniref:hypothetical protein n=1 Tax=Nocardioides sp. TRM66260-LWL TaxID=2874478 RepID=UPI001CC5B9C7|nr:hypothetical protein [Nocardioides sp. TRM66260-LWL]MBZ5735173.1 hypothetical protein [Nocardioides sp. TRM66260-LWL]
MTTLMTHLPAPKEVKDLIFGLLDKPIALRPGPPFAVSPLYPASIASFVDDSLVVRAVVALDLPLSAYLSAALALVPVAGAEAAIEEQRLSPPLAEALHEVFNVFATLFNVGDSAHVRLYNATPSGEPLAADARSRTQILGRREDLVVDITGYGTGRLAIVLC